MGLIQQDALTHDLIKEIFEQSAHEASFDSEGDVYIKGDGIEFPIWVCLDRDKLVKTFTFATMKSDVLFEDAIEFANDLNQLITLPSFSVIYDQYDNLRLWAHYFLPTQYGIDSKTLVSSVRRFSGAFRAGLMKDEFEIFFE